MKVSEDWREDQHPQRSLGRLEGGDVLGKTSQEKKMVSRAQMQKDGMRTKRFKIAHSDHAWNTWVRTVGTGSSMLCKGNWAGHRQARESWTRCTAPFIHTHSKGSGLWGWLEP